MADRLIYKYIMFSHTQVMGHPQSEQMHKFLHMLISQLQSMSDNIFMCEHLESRQKVFLKLTWLLLTVAV